VYRWRSPDDVCGAVERRDATALSPLCVYPVDRLCTDVAAHDCATARPVHPTRPSLTPLRPPPLTVSGRAPGASPRTRHVRARRAPRLLSLACGGVSRRFSGLPTTSEARPSGGRSAAGLYHLPVGQHQSRCSFRVFRPPRRFTVKTRQPGLGGQVTRLNYCGGSPASAFFGSPFCRAARRSWRPFVDAQSEGGGGRCRRDELVPKATTLTCLAAQAAFQPRRSSTFSYDARLCRPHESLPIDVHLLRSAPAVARMPRKRRVTTFRAAVC